MNLVSRTLVELVTRDSSVTVFFSTIDALVKKNLNAPRPSEHPPVRGENVKTFRWDHRPQIQNLFIAFKQVPRW